MGQEPCQGMSGLSAEHKDVEFVGIADPAEQGKTLAKENKVRHFPKYEDMLACVDAVIIATPTDTHYEVVKHCLLQGKHVFVEKPITTKAEHARELKQLAKDNHLVCQVGYIFRFNPAIIKLKEEIKKLGKLQYITGRFIHSTNPPRKDSGVIFNFGIHLIDILNFILEQKPEKVFCSQKHFLSKEREDVAFINLDYGNFIANLEVSWFHPEKKRDFWIIGEKAKLYIEFFDQVIKKYPITVGYDGCTRGPEEIIEVNKNEPLKAEVEDFITNVQGNGKLPVKKGPIEEEAYLTTKLCEACYESAKQGKELDFR